MLKDKVLHFYLRLGFAQSYNQLIYLLQKLPLIGKYLSNRLYSSKALRIILLILGLLNAAAKLIFGPALYLGILYFLGIGLGKMGQEFSFIENPLSNSDSFLLLLLVFSLGIGSLIKADLLELGNRDNTLAIKVFHLPARDYLLTKAVLDWLRFLLIFGGWLMVVFGLAGRAAGQAWSFVVLILGVRLALAYLYLHLYRPEQEKPSQYLAWTMGFGTVLSIFIGFLIYWLGWRGLLAGVTSYWAMGFGLALMTIFGLLLLRTTGLQSLANRLLTLTSLKNILETLPETAGMEVKEKDYQIDQVVAATSTDRKDYGMVYLNRLFYERFAGYFKKKMRLRQGIILLVVLGLNLLTYFGSKQGSESFPVSSDFFSYVLPGSLSIGYLLYSSEYYTKFCFYHLDRLLLKYSFYRQPEHVLMALKIRFLVLIKWHLPLLGIFWLGLLGIYWQIGAVSLLGILGLLLLEILIMLFFSFHHLVMYYLLQPFTVSMETKSVPYQLINTVFYLFSFQFFRFSQNISLVTFVGVVVFMLAYVLISFWLVMRYAPKRFKLR